MPNEYLPMNPAGSLDDNLTSPPGHAGRGACGRFVPVPVVLEIVY
jgi:hypothetical protein